MDNKTFENKLVAILNGEATIESEGPSHRPVPLHGVEKVGMVESAKTKSLFALVQELHRECEGAISEIGVQFGEIEKRDRCINLSDETLAPILTRARHTLLQSMQAELAFTRSIREDFPSHDRCDIELALCDGWIVIAERTNLREETLDLLDSLSSSGL